MPSKEGAPGHEDPIVGLITARPDATLVEILEGLRIPVGLSALWRETDRGHH